MSFDVHYKLPLSIAYFPVELAIDLEEMEIPAARLGREIEAALLHHARDLLIGNRQQDLRRRRVVPEDDSELLPRSIRNNDDERTVKVWHCRHFYQLLFIVISASAFYLLLMFLILVTALHVKRLLIL